MAQIKDNIFPPQQTPILPSQFFYLKKKKKTKLIFKYFETFFEMLNQARSPLSQFDRTKPPWLNLQYFGLFTCLQCHHGGGLELVVPSFFHSLYSHSFTLFTQT